MVFEIGELDNASQSALWAGCVSDPLHVRAVVVAFGACKKHERAELNRAQPPARSWPIVTSVRSSTSCSQAVTRACLGAAAATRRTWSSSGLPAAVCWPR